MACELVRLVGIGFVRTCFDERKIGNKRSQVYPQGRLTIF